jgi:hypothetical protein
MNTERSLRILIIHIDLWNSYSYELEFVEITCDLYFATSLEGIFPGLGGNFALRSFPSPD